MIDYTSWQHKPADTHSQQSQPSTKKGLQKCKYSHTHALTLTHNYKRCAKLLQAADLM